MGPCAPAESGQRGRGRPTEPREALASPVAAPRIASLARRNGKPQNGPARERSQGPFAAAFRISLQVARNERPIVRARRGAKPPLVCGFAQSPPNQTLMEFAAARRAGGCAAAARHRLRRRPQRRSARASRLDGRRDRPVARHAARGTATAHDRSARTQARPGAGADGTAADRRTQHGLHRRARHLEPGAARPRSFAPRCAKPRAWRGRAVRSSCSRSRVRRCPIPIDRCPASATSTPASRAGRKSSSPSKSSSRSLRRPASRWTRPFRSWSTTGVPEARSTWAARRSSSREPSRIQGRAIGRERRRACQEQAFLISCPPVKSS